MDQDAKLRRVAEQRLNTPGSAPQPADDKPRSEAHELCVHPTEPSLRSGGRRTGLTELTDRGLEHYLDLYEQAPVGYCVLSAAGLILEANLTAATLLGTDRDRLLMQPIHRFIVEQDQDLYELHHKQLFEQGGSVSWDVRLIRPDSALFWAYLTAVAARVAPDGAQVCRVTISNITERKRAEETLLEKLAGFECWRRLTVDREMQMIRLKKEVNALLKAAGRPEKHRIVGEEKGASGEWH